MTDIRVVWDPSELIADWLLTGSVLDTSRALESAVAVALFTDALADADDRLPDPSDPDRRGWWGDFEGDVIHGQTQGIGSRLWLISREKQTEQTRQRAEQYCREALQFLLDLQIATRVDVTAYWFRPQMLGVETVVWRGPEDRVALRFQPLWDEYAA